MDTKYQLYCCGSRGSRPVEGSRFNEFGGFTTCYVLKTDDYALVIDCGTGFYEANSMILDCSTIDIVITHMHYDHLLGMLDWDTLNQKSKITFYSGFDKWFGEDTFTEFFRAPFWPVQPSFVLKNTPPAGERLQLRDDLSVEFFPAPHPNEAQRMIIRSVDESGTESRICVMFDNESPDGIDKELLTNSDYLIYDGMYTDDEYEDKVGFGHSTWQEGVRLATRVNCKRLLITHHSPFRTDEELRGFEEKARDIYPSTDFARSGQHWDFPNTEASEKAERQTNQKGKVRKSLEEKLNEIVLDEEKFIRFASLGTYIILGLVSAFMTIVNIFTEKTLLMYSTLFFAVCCLINAILEYKKPQWNTIILGIFQWEMLALFTFFIVTGTPEGFSAIWILMLPIGGMLLFGIKRTMMLCAIMAFELIFFFETPLGQSYLQYEYTSSFMLRFPMAFLAFAFIGLFLGSVREKLRAELDNVRKNQALTIANQTSELRQQYLDIVRANSKLQLRNKALQKMIGEELSDDQIRMMINKETED